MKKFMAVALLVLGTQAMAFVETSANTVLFPGSIVKITDTCLNADGDLRTNFKVQQYKIIRKKNNDVYIPTVKKYLTTSVDYTQRVCVDYGKENCKSWETVYKTYPMTSTVDYYEVKRRRNSDVKKYLYSVEFTVPACK